jgi:hypothetical protein
MQLPLIPGDVVVLFAYSDLSGAKVPALVVSAYMSETGRIFGYIKAVRNHFEANIAWKILGYAYLLRFVPVD